MLGQLAEIHCPPGDSNNPALDGQTNYDRRHDQLNPPTISSEGSAIDNSNSVRTYTCHWYDKARRPAVTAYFGTNGTHGFDSGDVPLCVNVTAGVPRPAPQWACSGTPAACAYVVEGDDPEVAGPTVTRFGYDAAGRRIWTRDALGRVTRVWHDLLGHVLLEAENWRDCAPPAAGETVDENCGLTPYHSGPIRYTAYHYTRGGLLDMMVAISPPEGPSPSLTPGSFNWNDVDPNNDFAAGNFGFDADATPVPFQATRFVYGAEAVTESDHSAAISRIPGQLAEIRYPQTDGQPSEEADVLAFRFTPDGRLAQRVDQREVILDYCYGVYEGCPTCPPSDMLSKVTATIPTGSAVSTSVKELRFRHDAQGLLTSAISYPAPSSTNPVNEVLFSYDAFQNPLMEYQNPWGGTSQAKSVFYFWTTDGAQNRNRLDKIRYPSPGRELTFLYGAAGSTEDLISRPTGLADYSAGDVIRYAYTGGGRVAKKLWGPAANGTVSLDLASGATDALGRTTDLHFVGSGGTLARFQYTYDQNGNRTAARSAQLGHDNDRSYLYRYDELNRLILAEYGKLNANNDGFEATVPTPRARRWLLDALGNWSFGGADGEPSDDGALSFNDLDGDGVFDADDTMHGWEQHEVDARNQISRRRSKAAPGAATIDVTPTYDAAGNITNDGDYKYAYDAWNRLVKVQRASDNAQIATYAFDALGRRVNKKVSNSGALDTPGAGEFFYYEGNRIIEHHTPQPVTSTTCTTYTCGGGGEAKAVVDVASPLVGAEAAPVGKFIDGVYTETKTVVYPPGVSPSPSGEGRGEGAFSPLTKGAEGDQGGSPKEGGGSSAKDDSGIRSTTCTSCTTTTTYPVRMKRQFVYGFEGIDEEVAQFTDTENTTPYYVLQDAGGDVVGIAKSVGTLHEQYFYDPYGPILAAENYNGDVIDVANAPQTIFSPQLHKGLWADHEIRAHQVRNRFLTPYGRFGQRDPNGLGAVYASALLRNGQAASATAALSSTGQFDDGAHLYGYARNDPVMNSDPSGLTSAFTPDMSWADAFDDAAKAIQNAQAAQSWLWAQDWGDDDYAAAILDYTGDRENAIGTVGDAYQMAIDGFGQSRLYAKASAMWLQYYVDSVTPEGSLVDADLSSVIDLMDLTACFGTGTPITRADGSVAPIDQLKVGDVVLARDADGGPGTPVVDAEITNTYSRATDDYLRITVGTETFVVTSEHPFWVQERGWTPAASLAPETMVAAQNGYIAVSALARIHEPLPVYNLEVAAPHSYFVGSQRIWVHNNCVQEIHHIIPKALRDHALLRAVGLDIDDDANKMLLRRTTHRGRHDNYTKKYIKPQLDYIYKSVPSKQERLRALQKLQQNARKTLKQMENAGRKINKIRPWRVPRRFR